MTDFKRLLQVLLIGFVSACMAGCASLRLVYERGAPGSGASLQSTLQQGDHVFVTLDDGSRNGITVESVSAEQLSGSDDATWQTRTFQIDRIRAVERKERDSGKTALGITGIAIGGVLLFLLMISLGFHGA